MTDAFSRASRFNTALRRLDRAEEAVHESVRQRYAEKRRAMRGELDAEAYAIVVAAEGARDKASGRKATNALDEAAGFAPFDSASNGDGEPALSPRLLETPEPAARPIVGEAESRGRVRK